LKKKAVRYKSQLKKENQAKVKFESKLIKENERKEKLREQLRDLEEEELDYLSRLKKTVINKQKEFEDFKMNSLSTSRLITPSDLKGNRSISIQPESRFEDNY